MKKFATFLISATLLATSVNLSAQTEKNQTDGCQFRFVLEDLAGFGWGTGPGIKITVDGVEYGFVTLPWGTPSAEETLLLPSGEIHFLWPDGVGFNSNRHYFEIYNSFDELIYTSPEELPDFLFFTYQNECPECLPVSNFEGIYNSELKQVNLSWVAPESEYVTGFDIFRNGVLLARLDSTINSFSSQTDTLETGDYKYCVVPVYPYICDLEEKCFETYINNVGIKNYSFDLLLYPNPANNELRITNYELRITNVEIYDVFGRKVGEKFPFNVLKGWTAKPDGIVINISHLPAGVYIVKIFTDQGEVVEKIIKQ